MTEYENFYFLLEEVPLEICQKPKLHAYIFFSQTSSFPLPFVHRLSRLLSMISTYLAIRPSVYLTALSGTYVNRSLKRKLVDSYVDMSVAVFLRLASVQTQRVTELEGQGPPWCDVRSR